MIMRQKFILTSILCFSLFLPKWVHSNCLDLLKIKDISHPNGPIFSTSQLLSLYVFDRDLNSEIPTCNDACAETWPPILVEETISTQELENLQKCLEPNNVILSKIKRLSGQYQLAINGRPLYTFIKDQNIEDTLGDNLGKVWHLANTKSLNTQTNEN